MKRSYKWLALFLVIAFSMSMVVGCGGSAPAKDEKKEETYTIKFAHVVRPNHAKGQAADMMKELLEERSGGRIKVEVYPDSQLGDDRAITEQMQLGTIQMNAPFTGVLPAFVPQTQLFDLPFLFANNEAAFNVLHSEVGDILNGYLLEKGLRGLGYWDGGFKHITNNIRPIQMPSDMNGMKIRVSQSPLLVSQFRALGASGISIAFAELYTALQQGTVDGQENTLSNIYTRKFYEAQKHMTLSGHGYLGYVLLISEDFYQKLPADLQQLINEVAMEVSEWQWSIAYEEELDYLEKIRATGIEITELTPEQMEAFIEATKSVYDEFAKDIPGGQELLQAVYKARGY